MRVEELRRSLGRRVADIRRRTGLTQDELAERVKTATANISRLERGAAIPSVGRLAEIATALEVELVDLFTFESSETERRRLALRKIDYALRGRTPLDVEAVLTIIKHIFEIRRRGERTPSK